MVARVHGNKHDAEVDQDVAQFIMSYAGVCAYREERRDRDTEREMELDKDRERLRVETVFQGGKDGDGSEN